MSWLSRHLSRTCPDLSDGQVALVGRTGLLDSRWDRPPIAHGSPTMRSGEMAELVESRHDEVKRASETLTARGVITRPQVEEVPHPGPRPKKVAIYPVSMRPCWRDRSSPAGGVLPGVKPLGGRALCARAADQRSALQRPGIGAGSAGDHSRRRSADRAVPAMGRRHWASRAPASVIGDR